MSTDKRRPAPQTARHGVRTCRVCGCTDDDCRQCIEKTGEPCYWVEPDLCSACRSPRNAGMGEAPGYWMYETSGALRPAIAAYLSGDELTPGEIAAIRAYLRQWCNAPGFQGAEVEELRASVDGLISREAIARWLDRADDAGIDPL